MGKDEVLINLQKLRGAKYDSNNVAKAFGDNDKDIIFNEMLLDNNRYIMVH